MTRRESSLLPEGSRLLHIGPHKTGSTAIQSPSAALDDRLTEHGVDYVTPVQLRPRCRGLGSGLRGDRPGPPSRRRSTGTPRERGRRHRGRPGLVSNEDFGTRHPRARCRAPDGLGGRPGPVVPWRDGSTSSSPPSGRSGSSQATTVRSTTGCASCSTRQSRSRWDRRNVWRSHDVRALVERWVDVVGTDRFTVIVCRRERPAAVAARLRAPARPARRHCPSRDPSRSAIAA